MLLRELDKADQLRICFGIFADTNNNRIQLFHRGESNAITAAGTGSATISLNGPCGIILDADKYLYIADTLNHRIVGEGPNGFRCLVGCNVVAAPRGGYKGLSPPRIFLKGFENIYDLSAMSLSLL